MLKVVYLKGGLIEYKILGSHFLLLSFFGVFFFWPHHSEFGILVPQPRIEPKRPALGAWSRNHWTARESLIF